MGRKNKQKATPPHRSRVLLVDYDRIFDTLVYHIKQNPVERTRLWNLATAGFATTKEQGMLVCRHHEPNGDDGDDGGRENGEKKPGAKTLRCPAELASALEYWPHSRCIKYFPSYGPGRWDGRDGRPRGCPGSVFRYDGGYQHAVKEHKFPSEVLLAVFTLKGEDGSRADNINMGSFAAPVVMASDGRMVQRDTKLLKNMPNISHSTGEEVKMNPYTDTGNEGKGMGVSLVIPATYCAREGCTVCEYPRKTTVAVGDGNGDIIPGPSFNLPIHDGEGTCSCSENVVFKPLKEDRVKLMKCSRCSTVKYCSKECQKIDWKRHRNLCGSESHPITSAATEGVC